MIKSEKSQPTIALALAGGGPLGAVYEIGALCALDEALEGLDFTRLQHYVGVSAGGFIAASLANGISPRELCAGFIENSKGSEVFDPEWLTIPAYREFAQRASMLPGLALSALWRAGVRRNPWIQSVERLGSSLPTGIFSNEEVHRRLARLFSRPGRSNDFRELRAHLTLVATNLDSGESVAFGRTGWEHVPISKAVQATSALPGLFPPVEIDGGFFVDGALKKTMHASVALQEGVDLMLCLNPLVPFHALQPHPGSASRSCALGQRQASVIPRIVDGGLPAVLSQTFRSMIHSRLALRMKQYKRAYPRTDILLVEPDQRDPELYLANTFSYSQRAHMAEHAYQQTRALLRARQETLAPMLARHGIRLHTDVLEDRRRHLVIAPGARLECAFSSLRQTLDELSKALEPQAVHAV